MLLLRSGGPHRVCAGVKSGMRTCPHFRAHHGLRSELLDECDAEGATPCADDTHLANTRPMPDPPAPPEPPVGVEVRRPLRGQAAFASRRQVFQEAGGGRSRQERRKTPDPTDAKRLGLVAPARRHAPPRLMTEPWWSARVTITLRLPPRSQRPALDTCAAQALRFSGGGVAILSNGSFGWSPSRHASRSESALVGSAGHDGPARGGPGCLAFGLTWAPSPWSALAEMPVV